MAKYETVFVLSTGLEEALQGKFVEKIETMITSNGGTILDKSRWGKRRLAYEIKKKQYGEYFCLEYESSGNIIAVIEREFKLSEYVLRFMTLELNTKIILQRRKQNPDYLKNVSVKNEEVPAETAKAE